MRPTLSGKLLSKQGAEFSFGHFDALDQLDVKANVLAKNRIRFSCSKRV